MTWLTDPDIDALRTLLHDTPLGKLPLDRALPIKMRSEINLREVRLALIRGVRLGAIEDQGKALETQAKLADLRQRSEHIVRDLETYISVLRRPVEKWRFSESREMDAVLRRWADDHPEEIYRTSSKFEIDLAALEAGIGAAKIIRDRLAADEQRIVENFEITGDKRSDARESLPAQALMSVLIGAWVELGGALTKPTGNLEVLLGKFIRCAFEQIGLPMPGGDLFKSALAEAHAETAADAELGGQREK